MRNSADNLDPQIQCANCVRRPSWSSIETVLRKGNELQVEVGGDFLLHFQKGFNGQQPIVTGVDVAANCEEAHGHCPIAIGEGALDDSFVREKGLQFSPQSYAFEQRAGRINARNSIRESGIHMEMRVDKRRRHQTPACVDDLASLRLNPWLNRDDLITGDGDIDPAAIKQGAVLHNDVKNHFCSSCDTRLIVHLYGMRPSVRGDRWHDATWRSTPELKE